MIDACPRCGYSLTGLPDEHLCPECGFYYERDSVKVEEDQSGLKLAAIVGMPFVLAATFAWVMTGTMSIYWLLCLSAFISVPLRLGGRKRYVLVSSRRLRLIEKSGEETTYSMEDIAKARWSFVDGSVRVLTRSNVLVRSIELRYFRSNRQGQRLAAIINEYKNRE